MSTLIIYFSHTGENYVEGRIRSIDKGNTEVIAEMIQEFTNGDLFQIETINAYPFEYKQCTDQALEEKNAKALPVLKRYISSLEDYQEIYIGYPNWWGTMPMPVFSLLERLDFANKVIKPFCTHEGSGMGRSEEDLKRLCKNGELKNGLAIQGSSVWKSKDKVQKWILE